MKGFFQTCFLLHLYGVGIRTAGRLRETGEAVPGVTDIWRSSFTNAPHGARCFG